MRLFLPLRDGSGVVVVSGMVKRQILAPAFAALLAAFAVLSLVGCTQPTYPATRQEATPLSDVLVRKTPPPTANQAP
jgi:hypothetical protein